MKYNKLEINSFPFYEWILDGYLYFLVLESNGESKLSSFSGIDFSLTCRRDIRCNVFFPWEMEMYYYHTDDNIVKKINLNTFKISESRSKLIPKYSWGDLVCYFNLTNGIYEIINYNGEKVYGFEIKHPISVCYGIFGIYELYNAHKQNNWVRCIFPNRGEEKWRADFSWKINRLEQFEELLVLDYHAYETIRSDEGYEGQIDWHNPKRYSIVIDSKTGTEMWRSPIGFQKMDKRNGVLVTGTIDEFDSRTGSITAESVIEIDIKTGKVLTKVAVKPVDRLGYYLHFVDKEGIYYTNHYGSFGKISKQNGDVLWEFDLLDEKGVKRKVSNWLLLGNGKLVLQAMPNHPNGNLMCIFDPTENMGFSNIKDGIRKNDE